MSAKTGRAFLAIAFALFALALLACIVSIFAQVPLKKLITLDESILASKTAPYSSLVTCLVYTVLSLIFMLVAMGKPSKGVIYAIGIVIVVLFIVFEALVLPSVSLIVTGLVNRRGEVAFAAYNSLESIVSKTVTFMVVPARILMFLSIGGLFGKDLSKD